jgi:hypothetical protein
MSIHGSDLEDKRRALAGPGGVAGIFANSRMFGLALISMMAALNYGYEQGAYSQCLVMPAFIRMPAFARIINDSSYKGWTVA